MGLSLLGHEIANTAHANDSQSEGCKKLRFGVDRTAEKTLVPRDIATMQHPRGDVPQNAHYVVEHIGVAAKLCFGNKKSNPVKPLISNATRSFPTPMRRRAHEAHKGVENLILRLAVLAWRATVHEEWRPVHPPSKGGEPKIAELEVEKNEKSWQTSAMR